MGLIACDRGTYRRVKRSVQTLGCPPGPDDAYLCLRGMRTLRVRMRQHESSALAVARWLVQRPEVRRVMHPGLESHPQHDIFVRDFKGSSGLFSFQLDQGFSDAAVDALCDSLKVFFLLQNVCLLCVDALASAAAPLLPLLPLLCAPCWHSLLYVAGALRGGGRLALAWLLFAMPCSCRHDLYDHDIYHCIIGKP
jgi:hypothetical protein